MKLRRGKIKDLEERIERFTGYFIGHTEVANRRWEELEQRVHDAEQLLWAEISRRGTEEANPPGEYHDDEQPYGSTTPVPDRAAALSRAITNERAVMFRYTKEGETDWELRQLSPYEIIKAQNGIVVRGWCHDREEIRSFRLDRMDALTICDMFKGSDQDASYPVLRYRKPISS